MSLSLFSNKNIFKFFLNSGKLFIILQKVLQNAPFPGPNSTKEKFWFTQPYPKRNYPY